VSEVSPTWAAPSVSSSEWVITASSRLTAARLCHHRPLFSDRATACLSELMAREREHGVVGGKNLQKGHRPNMSLAVGTGQRSKASAAIGDAGQTSLVPELLGRLQPTVQARSIQSVLAIP
jgi:hypothetical protein